MLETIWESILPNILEIVLTIISLIIGYYVVPYIKNDLIPWLKEKRLYNIIKSFVQAVEKMAEAGLIEKADKKNEVIKLLKNKGIVINDTIDAFIESCVKELDIISSTVREEIIKTEENYSSMNIMLFLFVKLKEDLL